MPAAVEEATAVAKEAAASAAETMKKAEETVSKSAWETEKAIENGNFTMPAMPGVPKGTNEEIATTIKDMEAKIPSGYNVPVGPGMNFGVDFNKTAM